MAEQEQEQTILKLIASNGFISYNKIIARTFGVHEAIVLGELCSIYSYFNYKEFYINQERISNDTALSVKQIRTALTNLVDSEIIEVTKKGLPCKNWYTINGKLLNSLLSNENKNQEKGDDNDSNNEEKRETAQKGELDTPKMPNEIGKNGTSGCAERGALLSNKNTGVRIQNNNTSSVSSVSFHSPLDTECGEHAPNKKQDIQDNKGINTEQEDNISLANKIQDTKTECESDVQHEYQDQSNSDEIFPWETPEFMESAGLKKAAEYMPDGNKPKKKRKPRIPLAEREPVNDIERVEKAYMKALEDAEKKMPGITEKSYSGFRNIGCQRKRIKEWLKDYSAAEMETAIRLAVNDSFCTGQLNMVFSSILSDKVFLRLLHGNIKSYESQRKFPARPKENFVDGDRDYSNVTDW